MKTFKRLALCLAAMFMAMTVYASENDLLGRWVQTETEGGMIVIASYEFLPDGQLNQMLVLQGSSPKVDIAAEAVGKYEYKGNTITMKFKASDIDVTKFEIEGVDAGMAKIAIEQQKQQMAAQDTRLTDVKINGTTLTAKLGKEEVTMTKIQ